MRFKKGVKVNGIKPEIVLALNVVDSIIRDMVVTSVTEGRHSRGSLHYVGSACDIRTRNIPKNILNSVVASIRSALTYEYDVVLESNHLHIEFQPKHN